MVNVNDITITSLETINAFDVVTGSYWFTLDELQNATIAQTEDKSEITGKHGRKLANVKRNKAITISGTNGMVSGGLLEVQTGGKFERKATEVLWTDYLTVRNNLAATLYTAIGTTGAEIEELYTKNTNGSLGKQLVQTAEDPKAAGEFSYNPETKELKFFGIEDGTEIIVYYKRQIIADVLDNSSEDFSGKCMLYIDAIGEDKCANVYRIQFFIPKADFNGEFNLEMGENQTVHEFEAESLAGACGAAGVGSLLWTYTIFGDTAEDAPTGEEAFDKGQSGKVSLGEKSENDFMENAENGPTIKWADNVGYVQGKFKKVENYTQFSSASEQQTGAYFAFAFDDSYKGKPITCQRVSGEPGEPKTAVDTEWILRLADGKDTVYEFSIDGALILTLIFSEANFDALNSEAA